MPTANDRKRNTPRWRAYYAAWKRKNPHYGRDWMRDMRANRRTITILGVKVNLKRSVTEHGTTTKSS